MKHSYLLLLLTSCLFFGKAVAQNCFSLGCAANYGSQTIDGSVATSFGGPGECYDLFPYKQVFWQFFYSPSGGDFTQTYTPTSGGDPLDLDYVVFDMGTIAPVSIDCPIDESGWAEVLCNYSASSGVPTGPGVDGTAPTVAGHYYAIAVIGYQDVNPIYTFDIGNPQIGGVDLDANNCPGVLPVKLSSFNVKANNCVVKLDWTAESESGFKQYHVQYSTDGRTFNTLAVIAAQGANKRYEWQHNNPLQGRLFYRLKMIDIDGHIDYSKIIALNMYCGRSSVSVYPNPVTDILNVNISNAEKDPMTGILFDNNGKQVYKALMNSGTNLIDMTKFAKGVYILRLKNNTGVQNIKIIK